MFKSAEEFFGAVTKGDADSTKRVRTDTASLGVWMSIVTNYPELKRAVTLNKTLPAQVLAVLARDSNPLVRVDVANTRRLTRDIFELLAHDEDEGVRLRLAWNPKTPRDLLLQLSRDSCALVAEKATERLG